MSFNNLHHNRKYHKNFVRIIIVSISMIDATGPPKEVFYCSKIVNS
jgi:hypothetical protein